MKKNLALLLLALALPTAVFAQTKAVTLDEAIALTASELGTRLRSFALAGGTDPFQPGEERALEQSAAELRKRAAAQTKIAVASCSSDWEQLSAYIIDELNNAVVREGSLAVVDRRQLDVARKELNFQMSGDVDDTTAQSIGKFSGAQSVLTASFTVIGSTYRFRTRMIAVETGVVQYSNSLDIIKKDNIVKALTRKKPPKKAPVPKTPRQRIPLFDDYKFFNGLTLFGYNYSPETPAGFSLGVFGVYTSLGFAVPNWGDYEKITSDKSDTGYYLYYEAPDFNTAAYTDWRHEIIDWVIGYTVTIIPNYLYLPLGVGMESVQEWRLQELLDDGYGTRTKEWNTDLQWKQSVLFEVGLIYRIDTPANIAPYLFGSYRNIGLNTKHQFAIGAGISFDWVADDDR